MNRLSFATALCIAFVFSAAVHGSVSGAETRLVVIDPLTTVRSADDVVPAADTVRLVGPRNGVCSAPVVAFGPAAAMAPVLEGPGGVLPAECVSVRYAGIDSPYQQQPIHDRPWLPEPERLRPYYDVLQETPPAGAELTPVWLTVRIPADQESGDYTGTMRVGDASVPVRVTVSDWTCPSPSDWTTAVHLVMSPESLARQYRVELWSDEHWDLVRKELAFAAKLGNRMINIPVYYRNELNILPRVSFRKRGEEYEVDMGVAGRLLELHAEIVGEPTAVVVGAWEHGKCVSRRRREGGTVEVLVAEGDGAPEPARVPVCGEPGSEATMKPLLDGILDKVEDLGWSRDCVLLGWATDRRPTEEQVQFFERVAPGMRWAIITHGRAEAGYDHETGAASENGGKRIVSGMEIGYYAHPFAPRPWPWPRPDGIAGGWDLEYPEYFNYRVYMHHTASLTQYRCFPAGGMCTAFNRFTKKRAPCSAGLANVPLDFWEDEQGVSLLGRHTQNWVGGFHRRNTYWLIAPGPYGPIGTTRFEMLREGIQEVEARVFMEKLLAAEKVPEPLAAECREFLMGRMSVLWLDGKFANSNSQWQKGGRHDYRVPDDWQGSAARLFELAGAVARATNGKDEQ